MVDRGDRIQWHPRVRARSKALSSIDWISECPHRSKPSARCASCLLTVISSEDGRRHEWKKAVMINAVQSFSCPHYHALSVGTSVANRDSRRALNQHRVSRGVVQLRVYRSRGMALIKLSRSLWTVGDKRSTLFQSEGRRPPPPRSGFMSCILEHAHYSYRALSLPIDRTAGWGPH